MTIPSLPGLPMRRLALCIASALTLAACGGGSGVVRGDPPPPTPASPATPPTPPAVLCPAPLSGDCVVDAPYTPTFDEIQMTGGRQSDYALIKRGAGTLNLLGDYRFGAGTTVETGSLVVHDLLVSDTAIRDGAELWLVGTVRGTVANAGTLSVRTLCAPGGPCAPSMRARVEGDYTQLATGRLQAVLGWTLQITGHAQLDGALELVAQRLAGGQYVLPAAGTSQQLLHAEGGVSGRFSSWSAPSLFVEGTPRYEGNDVYFDLARISLPLALVANGVTDAATVRAGAQVDAAFASADRYARQPATSLTPTQRQFLASAAAVQYIGDPAQARATFASLSGDGHAQLQALVTGQAVETGTALDRRLAQVGGGSGGAWSEPLAASAGFRGMAHGVDQWLGPRLLVGGAVADAQADLRLAQGGSASGGTPTASVYLHYRGDGWHATGLAGAGRARLQVRRWLDLAGAGRQAVASDRQLGHGFVHAELGRDLVRRHARLTPFARVDYAMLQGSGFTETGNTGFELLAPASRSELWSTAVGLRYARAWTGAGEGSLRLDLEASVRQRLGAGGIGLRAAFTGAPEAAFLVPGWASGGRSSVLRLGLAGDWGRGWNWRLAAVRDSATPWASACCAERGWSIGVARTF